MTWNFTTFLFVVALIALVFVIGFEVGAHMVNHTWKEQLQKQGLGYYELCLTEMLSGEKHCAAVVDTNRLTGVLDD